MNHKIVVGTLLMIAWGALALNGLTPIEPFVEAIKGMLYGVCGYHAGTNLGKGE